MSGEWAVDRAMRIAEAATLTGFTIAQLRYFERLGLVKPSFEGPQRLYGSQQLYEIFRVRTLIELGYRPKEIVAILSVSALQQPRRNSTERGSRLRKLPEPRDAFWEEAQKFLNGGKKFEVAIGESARSYNTAYQRIRRLARQRGVDVRIRKRGEMLSVERADSKR